MWRPFSPKKQRRLGYCLYVLVGAEWGRGDVQGGDQAGPQAAHYEADRGDHADHRREPRREDIPGGVQSLRLSTMIRE